MAAEYERKVYRYVDDLGLELNSARDNFLAAHFAPKLSVFASAGIEWCKRRTKMSLG